MDTDRFVNEMFKVEPSTRYVAVVEDFKIVSLKQRPGLTLHTPP